jgi:RNA polymerase sigma-70 factor (ECF subfamily)
MGNRIQPRGPPAGRARAASKGAGFAALAFEKFGAGLYRYLLSSLRHPDTAEDLAQEVYLRLLRFADGELVQSPEDYVYRVAFNVLHEFRMHEKRLPVIFDSESLGTLGETLPSGEASAEELSDQRSQERQLEGALAQLPPVQQAVFLLAMRQDMAHEDIARKLGLSLHTVRKYLYRTMLHCRRQMAAEQQKGVVT